MGLLQNDSIFYAESSFVLKFCSKEWIPKVFKKSRYKTHTGLGSVLFKSIIKGHQQIFASPSFDWTVIIAHTLMCWQAKMGSIQPLTPT